MQRVERLQAGIRVWAARPWPSSNPRVRWRRVWWIGTAAAAVAVSLITIQRLEYAIAYLDPGIDYRTYTEAARTWLAGGGFYPAEQLTGSWTFHSGDPAHPPPILYPPAGLYLFLPFAFLPGALWWALPITFTAWAIVRFRPHPAGWLAIVLLLGLPESREPIFWGNPVMWAVAFEAAGFAFGWPGPFVLVKPTLAPFALAGVRHRTWVLGLSAFVVLNLPLIPMWVDWVKVIQGSTLSPDYSFSQYPLMAVPVVAWIARRRALASTDGAE